MVRPLPPLKERLGDLIDIDPATGCHVWRLGRDKCGYGRIAVNRRMIEAHRAVYECLVGPIRAGLQIDHLCRNRACVNPAHLEPVTPRENSLRSESPWGRNAKKTHCKSGHPFDEKNTYLDKRGQRVCRKCAAASQARHKVRTAHPHVLRVVDDEDRSANF